MVGKDSVWIDWLTKSCLIAFIVGIVLALCVGIWIGVRVAG